MKTISFKSALGILLLSTLLTSCTETKTTFTFTYACSNDLLQFVTPTASWKTTTGKEIRMVLPEESFKDNSEYVTISSGETTLSYWTRKIEFFGKGDARDMTITYVLKDNIPDVHKKYAIYHKLFGNQSIETSSWSNTTIVQDIPTIVENHELSIEYLSGDELIKALYEVVNHPDYVSIDPQFEIIYL